MKCQGDNCSIKHALFNTPGESKEIQDKQVSKRNEHEIHTCSECSKTFKTNRKLSLHKQTHGPRAFQCQKCDKAFYRSHALAMHMLLHTGSKPFECPHCDYKCTQSGSLVTHVRTHTKEKPYSCPQCDFTCAQSGALKAHIRKHTKVYPYQCVDCDFSSARSCDLVKHKRTHTNERPFKCSKCDSSFAQSNNLKTHMRIHTNLRPFSCNHCDSSFVQSAHLKKHTATYHTKEGQMRHKRQEELIYKALLAQGFSHFEGGDAHPPANSFKREHQIDFKCVGDMDNSFARIDFVIGTEGGLIFLEVDEFQHKFGYEPSCDMKRMSKVHESLAVAGCHIPIYWIRYNPNEFSVDREKGKAARPDREKQLFEYIEQVNMVHAAPMQIKYMYYDTVNGVPEVTLHDNYRLVV
jgi:uncharacterized Zn-finger protein